jgi:transcriptional regulator with XRE-family HTH domain
MDMTYEATLSATEENPPSVRSAAMIDRMRQGLKRAIKELRGDMTQAAFARRIGIRQAALARMESLSNEVFPSTPLLIRIALVSSRDLQVSFVKRTLDVSGADMLTADTAGFPTSAELKDYRVVIQDRLPSEASSDDTVHGILPIHAIIERA